MLKFLRRRHRSESASLEPGARRRIDLGDEEPPYIIYAIGDIHGCVDLLLRAEEQIYDDAARSGVPALTILLGDYIDRGPSSRDVLEHLCKPLSGNVKRLAICGNHDDLFARFLKKPKANRDWLDMGGRQTLTSYGLSADAPLDQLTEQLAEVVPEHHVKFLSNLPVYAKVGHHVFVHAGLRPGIALAQQTEADMMWIREPFLSQGPQLPLLVVHGHTPSKKPTSGPQRIGIDTGAYVTGRLSILRIVPGEAPDFLD